MKKFAMVFIAILAICAGLAYGSNQLTKSTGDSGNKVLNLYNWGDYIDPNLLTKFQKKPVITSMWIPSIVMKQCTPRYSRAALIMI